MKSENRFEITIFWLIIVFYLDPGGFVDENVKPIMRNFLSFLVTGIAWLIFLWHYNKNENVYINKKYLNSYIIVISLWLAYYFVWYYGFNNIFYNNVVKSFANNARALNPPLLVIPIVYFASIGLMKFIKVLSISTIIIIFLFILSVLSGVELIPFWKTNRGWGVNLTRYFMHGEGIIYILIPILISMIMIKFRKNYYVLISAFLVICYILLTIVRRNIIGIVEYTIIIAFLTNYIQGRNPFISIKKYVNFKTVSVSIILFFIVSFYSPKFLSSVENLVENTFKTAIMGGDFRESEDARMSLTENVAIVSAIMNNFFGGTGFHPDWLEGEGGNRGWEGSDYIFLSAFGMYGIIGLLIFLPFYIITFLIIMEFLRFIRTNIELIYENQSIFIYPVIVGIGCSAEFIKNMIEYPNWFHAIGAIKNSPMYFFYFGLLLGSYYCVQKIVLIIKMEENED